MKNENALSENQIDFVIGCLQTYRNLFRIRYDRDPTPIDIEHSSLLYWLLKGNEPLRNPPPKFWSRPYHPIDAYPGLRVSCDGPPVDIFKDGRWQINQDNRFTNIGPNVYKHDNGNSYKVTYENEKIFIHRI